jgi:hypothetical protein
MIANHREQWLAIKRVSTSLGSGRSRSAPSGAHDGEGRRRLGHEASNAEAQEKPTVWSAGLRPSQRPLRANAQNSTNGGGKKQAETPEQCGYEGPAVR